MMESKVTLKDGVEKKKSTDYSEVMRMYKETKNPLMAFMVRPKMIKMGIQEKDEKILMLLRRHLITNVPWLFVCVVMFVAPFLISVLPIVPGFIPDRFVVATVMLWYLLVLGIGINGFLSWYYNVYIITDERIVDVDFLNLIYKNISSAKIDNIQDVTVEMGGTLRSVLNFGNVFIQTAAEKNEFEFEDVPNPQQVAKFLNEMITEEEREKLEGRTS